MSPNDAFIKDLPNQICWRIAEKLDTLQTPNWKTLISKMPKNLYDERAVLRFHMSILKPLGSPTLELLADLGRKKKTVGQLVHWLKDIDNSSELIYFLERGEEAFKELSPAIERQPESVILCEAGGALNLYVEASGKSPLKYQWFKGNYKLKEHTTNVLNLGSVSLQHSGFYICRVANEYNFIYTNWSKVDVVEPVTATPPTLSIMNQNVFNEPLVTMHPRSATVVHGETLKLYADAVGDPSPSLQWCHNNKPLFGECMRQLTIPNISEQHEGFYHLEASNKFTSTKSLKAQVTVVKRCKTDIESDPEKYIRGPADAGVESGVSIIPPKAPTEKIALVIGNENYLHQDKLGQLVHPVNDAHDVAAELRSLDFKVVSLINLNLEDMRNAVKFFCGLLDSGTYALFYFAGHGFEIEGESYLMALDATDRYVPEENLSLSEVITPLTKKNPKLSVLLIDSCRTQPELCRQDPILKAPYQSGLQRKNVTIGYGCCARGRVLESPQMRNGYFAHHLLENISRDVKIDDVLFLVAKGIHEDQIIDPATGRTQVVYRHSTVVDDLRLTDNIQSPDQTSNQLSAWQHAHVAPDSPVTVLQNDHVTVQLIFTPEFSNCLLVQSKIIEKRKLESRNLIFFLPQQIGGATVQTISPERREKGINLDDKIVRISNIERLEGNIDIHLEVTYEYNDMQHKQRAFYCIQEKPLYAKISEEMKLMQN